MSKRTAVYRWRKEILRATQATLARRLGVRQGTYSEYERGNLVWPPEVARELLRIADGNLTWDDLYPKKVLAARRRRRRVKPDLMGKCLSCPPRRRQAAG